MRAVLSLLALGTVGYAATPVEHFETRVRPVLAKHCYACHGPAKQFSGLRVDSRETLLQGGKRGPAINPGNPDESLLVNALHHTSLGMPPGYRLAPKEVADIEQWIKEGAVWPASPNAKAAARDPYGWYDDAVRKHWAFQPLKPAAALVLPAPKSAPADKRTLLRRASFVLTGLPPSAQDLSAFLADNTPQAFAKAVDRMLASPHFGEQWARHWMDVVRYGETRGYEWNYEIVGAWRYRDYLIRAFNSDVPYDQFVKEHIAGDLLAKPRVVNGVNESLTGTAFFRLGEAGHDDCIKFREISTDVIDNQIDTLSKAFQGMTVSCARCHNHKLDPIPTADYYGLYGILNSSRAVTHTLDTKGPLPPAAEQIRDSVKPAVRDELARIWRSAKLALPAKGEFKMEHPLHAWVALQSPANFSEAWSKLTAEYARERDARAAFNKANFTPFDADWNADGLGLRDGAMPAGDFALAPDGTALLTALLPAGVHTNRITDRWNGSLRSPLLPKTHKFASLRVLGGKLSAGRTVLDNCAIGEGYKVLTSASPSWLKLKTEANEKLPVFLEVVTKSDNPRIPDRPGVLKNKPEEIASPRSWFGYVRTVLHDVDESPREELSHMDRLFATPIRSVAELQARYEAIVQEAAEKWAQRQATDDDIRWLDAFLQAGLLPNSAEASPKLAELQAAYRKAESQLPEPRVVDGMGDAGQGFDAPVFRAGDPKAPGDVTPRHFLSKIGPVWNGVQSAGSGRRELADWIAGPQNPLTARVMVNRVWAHVFGTGLVRTVDNFGQEGEKPSDQALLDTLAAGFITDQWSVKRLVRRLVLSPSFQQSTPGYPLRRLSAESIRDAVLAASGRLDLTLYGPSIAPHRLNPQDYRRLFDGPLDGKGRRSLYTQITRMEGPRFLEIFDYPNPMAARGARDVTNVPAQALALLNDPFILQQAGVWAESLVKLAPEQRIPKMFETALQRPPTAAERDRFQTLAADLARLHNLPADSPVVWKDVAHALFNLKEFIYLP